MNTFFRDLFEYNYRFNLELLESLVKNSKNLPEHSYSLFCHVLNAHEIWNSRILKETSELKVWDIYPPEDAGEINRDNYHNSLHLLDDVDLDEKISYTNAKGVKYNNPIRDILFHIINHSTHHRGQIVAEFRKNGVEPVVTDYIFYKRGD